MINYYRLFLPDQRAARPVTKGRHVLLMTGEYMYLPADELCKTHHLHHRHQQSTTFCRWSRNLLATVRNDVVKKSRNFTMQFKSVRKFTLFRRLRRAFRCRGTIVRRQRIERNERYEGSCAYWRLSAPLYIAVSGRDNTVQAVANATRLCINGNVFKRAQPTHRLACGISYIYNCLHRSDADYPFGLVLTSSDHRRRRANATLLTRSFIPPFTHYSPCSFYALKADRIDEFSSKHSRTPQSITIPTPNDKCAPPESE